MSVATVWRRVTSRVETGGFIRRLVGWLILGALIVALTSIVGVAYSKPTIKDFLGGKLAVMALILSLGMFQYQVFHGVLDRYQARLENPGWRDYFQRVGTLLETPSASQALREEYENNRAVWATHTRETRNFIREGIVRHNFAILANVLAVSAALFASVAADAVVLMREVDAHTLREISTGAFFFSAIPFFGLLGRYVYSLIGEERLYYDSFREPPVVSEATQTPGSPGQVSSGDKGGADGPTR